MIEGRRKQAHQMVCAVQLESGLRIPSRCDARDRSLCRMTAQDCGKESMRASVFACEPSGEPSSKNARRYQSPSHAKSSIASLNIALLARATRATDVPVRVSQSTARTSPRPRTRNQASQTLSPCPFDAHVIHAVVPIAIAEQAANRGSRAARRVRGPAGNVPTEARCAVETSAGRTVAPVRPASAVALPGTRPPRQDAASPVTRNIVRHHERQPQQIVGTARAHAHAGFRMPPVLHVALDELPAAAAEYARA